jgi:serine/threonine protein kinase/Tfp pilus assembly protein PilF
MSDTTRPNDGSQINLKQGSQLSHYRIIGKIGVGGMGEVYSAEDTKLQRKIAIKIIPPHLASIPEHKTRFEREAQAVAAIKHPNIVTLYSIENAKEFSFITMELVGGKKLSEILSENLTQEQIREIAISLTEGVGSAHKKGIAHRDLKPDNIMIDNDNRLKILDFGLAKLLDQKKESDNTVSIKDDNLTKSGQFFGTIAYMSPEQAESKKTDLRSDVFSLGIILFELATGQHPFRGSSPAATISSILLKDPPVIKTLKPELSDKFEKIIYKALIKNPDDRYQSAQEMYLDLKHVLGNLNSSSTVKQTEQASLRNSIAVLPFANISADPENEYFSDGITEEIINSLTQLKNLRVAARTSSFFFKDKTIDIKEIGNKLNVETVLEGSVRRAGGKLRITAQLINVQDGYHLWSERYDRGMEDIFAVQDEIAQTIAKKFEITLTKSEKNDLVQQGTENVQAHDLYLRGRFYWEQRGKKLQNALNFFSQALELDPNYALAHVGVGDAYHMMGLYGILPPEECMPKAKEAALKALKINNSLSEAHTTLAMVSLLYDRDWATSEKMFRRSIELNPNYVQARYWFAYWYLYLYKGNTEEAITEVKKAIDLDPLAVLPTMHYALILWMEGRYKEVLEITKEVEQRDPVAFRQYWWVNGSCYAELNEYDKALSTCPDSLDIVKRHQWSVAFHGYILATVGMKKEAEELHTKLIEQSNEKHISPFPLSIIPLALGNNEESLSILEKSIDVRDSAIIMARKWVMHSKLHDDPRFKSILIKAGIN